MANIGPGPPRTDPSGFLTDLIGADVLVKLNSGTIYKGTLQTIDGYMNIALEKAREYVGEREHRTYEDAFIRGNNVMYIAKMGVPQRGMDSDE